MKKTNKTKKAVKQEPSQYDIEEAIIRKMESSLELVRLATGALMASNPTGKTNKESKEMFFSLLDNSLEGVAIGVAKIPTMSVMDGCIAVGNMTKVAYDMLGIIMAVGIDSDNREKAEEILKDCVAYLDAVQKTLNAAEPTE
jgi:reverse gyrase